MTYPAYLIEDVRLTDIPVHRQIGMLSGFDVYLLAMFSNACPICWETCSTHRPRRPFRGWRGVRIHMGKAHRR